MNIGQEILGILSEFLYLGRCANIVSPFIKESKSVMFVTSRNTLSPNDPKFPEWWKEHKSEWEDRKKGGIEPSDD